MPISLPALLQRVSQAGFFSDEAERLVKQSLFVAGASEKLLTHPNVREGIHAYMDSALARAELRESYAAYRALITQGQAERVSLFPLLFRPATTGLSVPPERVGQSAAERDDLTPADLLLVDDEDPERTDNLPADVIRLNLPANQGVQEEQYFLPDSELEQAIYNVGDRLLQEREATQAYAREGFVVGQAFAQMDVITKALLEAPELLEKVIAVTKAVADPSLNDQQLLVMIRTQFPKTDARLPWYLNVGITLSHLPFMPPALLAGVLRVGVKFMSQRFIIGDDYTVFRPRLLSMASQNRRLIGDILGEAITTDEQGVAVTKAYLDLLDRLIADEKVRKLAKQKLNAQTYVARAFPDFEQPEAQIALKLSSLTTQFDPLNPLASKTAVKERLRLILDKLVEAKEKKINIGLTIDLEEFRLRDFTYAIFKEVLMEPKYVKLMHVGVVVQAYHRDSLAVLEDLAAWSTQRGGSILVRLVKGAYHHLEMEEAQLYRYEPPVFTEKWMSDFHYERCLDYMMTQYPHLRTAVASHNLRTQSYAMVQSNQKNVPIEAQMLFGLEDRSKGVLARRVPLAVYTPMGDPVTGAAYLTRRMKETGAGDGYLAQLASGKVDRSHLLQNPIMAGGKNPYARYAEQRKHFPSCAHVLLARKAALTKTRS